MRCTCNVAKYLEENHLLFLFMLQYNPFIQACSHAMTIDIKEVNELASNDLRRLSLVAGLYTFQSVCFRQLFPQNYKQLATLMLCDASGVLIKSLNGADYQQQWCVTSMDLIVGHYKCRLVCESLTIEIVQGMKLVSSYIPL